MNINSVWIAHPPKWPNCGRCDTCSHQRPDERIWDFYREYVGCSGLIIKAGVFAPAFYDVFSEDNDS